MTDKQPDTDITKVSDETLAKLGATIDSERERRGQTFSNVDWGRLSPSEFETEKNRVIAASERAVKAAEAERLRREAGGE